MVSSSRHILARIPSISFPVRMIDGVRISISSNSSSQSKSIQRKEENHHPKSGEKRDVKVVVSEEECEIVNVSSVQQTLSFSMSRIRLTLVLYCRFMTSSSALLKRLKFVSMNIYVYLLSYSLTVLLSYSLTLSHSLNKDGWIPTRVGHECRR